MVILSKNGLWERSVSRLISEDEWLCGWEETGPTTQQCIHRTLD